MNRHTATQVIDYRNRYGKTRPATITAEGAPGGVYIDVSFDGSKPVEVINVWDYRAGVSGFTDAAQLPEILAEWIKDQDNEEREHLEPDDRPDDRAWVLNYLENARF